MFSLIITIISIALVAALALATLYYGGSAFNKGSAGAKAAQLINEGQQINGAVQIFKADSAANSVVGVAPTTVAGLAPSYLSSVPAGWAATTTIDAAAAGVVYTAAAVSADVCAEVNKRAGLTGTDVDATGSNTGVYGCVTATGAQKDFVFYKF